MKQSSSNVTKRPERTSRPRRPPTGSAASRRHSTGALTGQGVGGQSANRPCRRNNGRPGRSVDGGARPPSGHLEGGRRRHPGRSLCRGGGPAGQGGSYKCRVGGRGELGAACRTSPPRRCPRSCRPARSGIRLPSLPAGGARTARSRPRCPSTESADGRRGRPSRLVRAKQAFQDADRDLIRRRADAASAHKNLTECQSEIRSIPPSDQLDALRAESAELTEAVRRAEEATREAEAHARRHRESATYADALDGEQVAEQQVTGLAASEGVLRSQLRSLRAAVAELPDEHELGAQLAEAARLKDELDKADSA